MKLYTADRETGSFIEEVNSLDDGLTLIKEYEEADKADGTYTPNFYDVVNEDHCSIFNLKGENMKYLAKNYDKEVQFDEDQVQEAKEYWGVKEDCQTLDDVAFWWNSEHSGDGEGELVVFDR